MAEVWPHDLTDMHVSEAFVGYSTGRILYIKAGDCPPVCCINPISVTTKANNPDQAVSPALRNLPSRSLGISVSIRPSMAAREL